MKGIIYLLLIGMFVSCSTKNEKESELTMQFTGYTIKILQGTFEECNYTSVYFTCRLSNKLNRDIKIGSIKNYRVCFKEKEISDASLISGKDSFELKIMNLPKILKANSTVDFDCFLRNYKIDGSFQYIKNRIESDIIQNNSFIVLGVKIDGNKKSVFRKQDDWKVAYQINEYEPSFDIKSKKFKNVVFRDNEFVKYEKITMPLMKVDYVK